MDTRVLVKLYAVEGPFVSVYLDATSQVEQAADRLETNWKNVLRELETAGVDEATRTALTDARGGHELGNTRVLVAAHGTVHLAVSLPQPPPRQEVTVGALPRLVPLVDALSLRRPHVVVLADRKGADVLAYTGGPDPDEVVSQTTERFPDRKTRTGGWATKRFSNDVEESWELSARDVAALVDRVARDIDARLVIASGDERALQLIGQHLPAELVDGFVTIGGGGRHVDGSADVIADEVQRVLGERIAAETVELLEDFAEQRGRRDRAADGIEATIEALRKGQVETLILTDARAVDLPAYVGPDSSHISLTPEDLLDLGVEQPWQAPLEEALVRAALGSAADIRFVGGGMAQSPSQGVGALLRYAD